MDYGHWITEIDFEPSELFGFVYEIIHKESGRTYIGKKQLRYTNRKKVTGRKNRKKVIKESDWKTYTGSCKELNEEITEIGKEQYKFVIIKLCKTKRELGYTETELQIDFGISPFLFFTYFKLIFFLIIFFTLLTTL